MTKPTVRTPSGIIIVPPYANQVYADAVYNGDERNSNIFSTHTESQCPIYTINVQTGIGSSLIASGFQQSTTNMMGDNIVGNSSMNAPVKPDNRYDYCQYPFGIFLFDYITMRENEVLAGSLCVPSDSVLIYRPDRRLEVWRFVSYMLLHANWFHLSFNIIIQLLFGVPLEMAHGSKRTAVIYMGGVLAGSLGTSVVESEAYLVGASGGVYALLSAQLVNILMNATQLRYGVSQYYAFVTFDKLFVICDLIYLLYTYLRFETSKGTVLTVSCISHMSGTHAGLTISLLVLKHLSPDTKSNLIWWLAFTVYIIFTVFAIVFNLLNTMEAQRLEEERTLAKQHFLNALGIP